MPEQHLAILGAGHMGRALVGGLLRSGTLPERIAVGESSEAARAALARDLGVAATADNARAVEGAAVVVLAELPLWRFFDAMRDEYILSREQVLAIKQSRELLDTEPTLQGSAPCRH